MSRVKRLTSAAALTGALGASVLLAGPAPVADAAPALRFTTVVSGLDIPWDLTWVGQTMLYDQRGGGIWSKRGSAAPQRLSIPLPAPFVNSEGGMLGMVADPGAATNRVFYTCQTVASTHDVQVWRWQLSTDGTSAKRYGTKNPLVDDIPLKGGDNAGRHTGCRLRFSAKGMLYVGTGDSAVGTNPQSTSSLGGKVLRLHPDGRIPTTNPFYERGGDARYVWSIGHRNVQGLALRPGTGQMYNAEQGTDRDDEVNIVHKGANYGYNPVPGYDESVPMTDTRKYPRAIKAVWSSGNPTKATSGITFLSGSSWGSWNGALTVGQLKATGIRLVFLDETGHQTSTKMVPGTTGYGRIRTVQLGPDKALYFTTSNGSGSDKIVRVTAS